MHDAQTFAVEILAPGDLVGLAQCIALDADAFLRGFPIPAGTQLPCPATG